VSLEPTGPAISSRMVNLFVESTLQQVGSDNLPGILAKVRLEMQDLEKGALARLGGQPAARLYASVQQSLRLSYGRGARGLLMRIGRSMWDRMVLQASFREKAELEIARRLPVPARRRRVLVLLADRLREGGGAAMVHTMDLDLLLADRSGAATSGQTSGEAICFVTQGLVQGALFWSTGKEADVEEITCKAAGAPACEFKITFGGK
jgi:predicted hydrocarbon binding protein